MTDPDDDRVSRRRYERAIRAREEAERLLEEKSRALYLANQQLNKHTETLDRKVSERTAELQTALEKAHTSSAMRSRFVATMSHEIRTPLGGLLGMIDLLGTSETDPERRDLLSYAKTSGEALKRIVNDVLDFSKMEAGAFHFENESVDIRASIDSVVALARMVIPDGPTRLNVEIDEDVPARFAGDATRIRQVVSNFVSNAGRYSSEGPITVRARAGAHDKGALLRIEVSDTGVGISPDQQKSLFQDFSQIQNRLTSAAQGTGLGLAISKRIIEGCGGTIGVDSAEGIGSTFWFELPVEVLDHCPDTELAEADALPRPMARDLSGRRVLVAEDNRINQKLILAYLKRLGVSCEMAGNGRIAVEKFAPGRFDLILMDVAMPEMDGFEAIRKLRETWPHESLPPIIVLTAHVMDAVREESETVGADMVLSKPITFDDLEQAMGKAIADFAEGTRTTRVPRSTPAPEPAPAVAELMDAATAEALLQTFNAADLVSLVREYLTDGRKLVGNMDALFKTGELEAVSGQAHALKGASGFLGFRAVAELAEVVEGSTQDLDAASMAEIRASVLEQFHAIEQAL